MAKYTVIAAWIGWKLIDVSSRKKIKWYLSLDSALWACRNLNRDEGDRYRYEV